MAHESSERRTRIDQQIHAIELTNEVLDITGGRMHVQESDDLDPAIAVQFWENVLELETAPRITLADHLEAMGVQLPPVETFGDELVSLKLWEVLDALVRLRVHLDETDHLSDRELYEVLVSYLLKEQVSLLPNKKGFAIHTSPIGSGSAEAMQIYHRYYASDESREQWLEQFPDYIMPEKDALPYDRDSILRDRFVGE